MAVVNATVTRSEDGSVLFVSWDNLANSDTGAPVAFSEWADRSVQVVAVDYGVGGNLRWEGSNDAGATYTVLTDPQGTALDFTADGIEAVTEVCQLARPNVTAGDVNTDISVHVVLRRENNLRT